MTYNIAGLPEASSDEDRIERYYTYDALYGRLDRIYDVDNNYIEHQYDLQGNLIERSRHDAAGARFGRKRFSFAGAEIPGKLYREINFDDTYTEYHYDGAGNVSLMTDAEGNVTEYRYDAFNRLTEVIQSLDEGGDVVTSYRHDAHGNMASVTDAEGRRTAYAHDDMGRVVAIISADTGTTRYAYDGAGNLIRKTDANGITTQYGYDSLNRLKDIKFPDITQNITYTYDQGQNGVGYRTGMADASGNTLFGYDPRGRLVFKFSTVNAIASWVGRAFTPAGRVQSVIYPSGRRIDYARNGSGRIKAMTTALNGQMTTLVSGLEHNPFGGPAGMNTGYGGAVNNRSGECACLEAANPGAFMEQNYLYDGNRNLLSIRATNTPWLNQDFYYDALNRLIRAGGIYGTIEYTYDKVGNRLTRSINDQTETYRYFPGSNRLSEVGGAPALSYTYDLNGNITGVDDKTLIYNQNNRLIQVKKNGTVLGEYNYNGMGQRILRTADGVTTIFVYDFDGNIIAESRPDGTLTAEYLYLLGNRIARVDVETETFSYYLNNYLGTPLLMTDDTGKVVWEAFYKPFGDAYVNPNSELVNNFRFAGQYYDKETGLHYNYHRYYDPKTGRYLTPDPIGLAGGINLFSYAANNPVNLIDPFGLEFSDIVPGIRKAFVEGAKGGTYAVGEATKATSDIAIHGHPLAKVAIGVAAVSEIVPMSGAIALSAISQVTSAIVISAPYSPIVTDAVHGFFVPGPPPPSPAGYAGMSARQFIVDPFVDAIDHWLINKSLKNNCE